MGRKNAAAPARPDVSVARAVMPDVDNDWYTPKVMHLQPLVIAVTAGEKGKGRVRCEIEEVEWERRVVDVRLIFERVRVPGESFCSSDFHSTLSNEFGSGMVGTFAPEHLDMLIQVLVAARDEANKHGLLTARPTPTSIRGVADVLAVAG